MVSGTDWLRRSFPSRVAKTARICSKRRATSRPFLSPASVMTVKWAEWTSSQGEGSAAAAGLEHRNSPHSVRQSAMARVRGIVPRKGNALKGNATTMVWVSVVLWFAGPPFRRLSRSVRPNCEGRMPAYQGAYNSRECLSARETGFVFFASAWCCSRLQLSLLFPDLPGTAC